MLESAEWNFLNECLYFSTYIIHSDSGALLSVNFPFFESMTMVDLCISLPLHLIQFMHLFHCVIFFSLDFIKLSALGGFQYTNNFKLLQNLATQCENWWFTRLNFLSVNEMQSKWFIICFKFDKHKRRTLIFFSLCRCGLFAFINHYFLFLFGWCSFWTTPKKERRRIKFAKNDYQNFEFKHMKKT